MRAFYLFIIVILSSSLLKIVCKTKNQPLGVSDIIQYCFSSIIRCAAAAAASESTVPLPHLSAEDIDRILADISEEE
jgi:hypothetical protein